MKNDKKRYLLSAALVIITLASMLFILNQSNNTAQAAVLGLDGSVGQQGTGTIQLSLVTSSGPDVLYLSTVSYNSENVSGISSNPSLTWIKRASIQYDSSSRILNTFYAIKPTAGTTAITINFAGNTYGKAAAAFGISGANTTSPFDITTPASNIGNSATALTSITTNSANDFIIGAVATETYPSLTSNNSMTTIIRSPTSSYRQTADEYRTVSSKLTNANVGFTWSGTQYWAMVADAVKQATTAITFTTNGLSSDTGSATIYTIDGTSYAASALPKIFNWQAGSTHSVTASNTITSTVSGKQYLWTSWTNGNGLSTSSGTFTTPNIDTTVNANWKTQYQVNFAVIGSGLITSPSSGNGFYDSGSLTVTASANTGYTFSHWSSNTGSITFASSTSLSTTATIGGAGTISATFAINTYDITPSVVGGASGHGTISPNSIQTANYGSTPTFNFQPDNGYHVAEVKVDNILTTPTTPTSYTFPSIHASHSISVSFAPDAINTKLTVFISPAIYDTNDPHTLNIHGTLADVNSNLLAGQTITLWYNDGQNWIQIDQTTPIITTSTGDYTHNWQDYPYDLPNGFYVIEARFAQNNPYQPSQADTNTTNNGVNLNVLPEYVLGSLAALGACFVGFVVFKKRSSLPHFKQL